MKDDSFETLGFILMVAAFWIVAFVIWWFW